MEPEGSLLFSQEFATGPCHEPDESNPHPRTLLRCLYQDGVCKYSRVYDLLI